MEIFCQILHYLTMVFCFWSLFGNLYMLITHTSGLIEIKLIIKKSKLKKSRKLDDDITLFIMKVDNKNK